MFAGWKVCDAIKTVSWLENKLVITFSPQNNTNSSLVACANLTKTNPLFPENWTELRVCFSDIFKTSRPAFNRKTQDSVPRKAPQPSQVWACLPPALWFKRGSLMRRIRSKPACNICGVPGMEQIPPLFVVHCLGAQQGDKSRSEQTERWGGGFPLYSPQWLEYTFKHNPLLALCGDYWLNGIWGISPHLRWDLPLEWHGVHFHLVQNVGHFIVWVIRKPVQSTE